MYCYVPNSAAGTSFAKFNRATTAKTIPEMSEPTYTSEPVQRQSCFSTTSSGTTRRSPQAHERPGKSDILSERSRLEGSANVTGNGGSSDEPQSSSSTENASRGRYPLTERSKREMAARIRAAREGQRERIGMANETIARGARLIKVCVASLR